MPYHLLLDGAERAAARQVQDRHHRPRHRPVLRRQVHAHRHPRAGPAGREDPARKIDAALQEKNCLLQRYDIGVARRGPGRGRAAAATASASSPFICDASLLVNGALDEGKHVLFEGAQGTLLDIDFGTYPFVTS